ncbi:FimV/HubP family polar landmark protein [Vibrio litoralis]|uniref:FimV/HubP family polar landmark protein n=1 Tax=Vibrio litoralis TaxID=335972 RepID=UPI0004861AFC|nr:FimV/HubP family polar landmark protein [Vibrio litoralis]
MRRTFKHFIAPVTLLFVTQISVACADDSRVTVEPSNHVPAQSSSDVAAFEPTEDIASIYGPTGEDETLWSIAKAYRPSKTVSVAQTVLATYKLNQKAFEDHNIHGLIPGSVLRLPTLELIEKESTQDAVEIIQRDKLRPVPSQVDESIQPPKPATLADYPSTQPSPDLSNSDNAKTLNEHLNGKQQVISDEQSESVAPVDAQATTESQQGTESQSITNSQQTLDIQTDEEQVELTQVEAMNDRLTSELDKIQQQLNELKTSLKADEQNRLQINEAEAQSTSIDTPQAFVRIANQHPWLWFIILLPLILILFIIRLLFSHRPKRSEELERLVAPQETIEPARLVVDTASTQPQASSETETFEFSDDELPEYGEDEARHDADTEPQAFEADIPTVEDIEDDIANHKLDDALVSDLNSDSIISDDSIVLTEDNPAEAVDSSYIETQPQPKAELGNADQIDSENINEQEEPDLDVGLDEFPDVLGDVNDFDVDINAEMNSNLDLAKVFLEMGDERTAIKLLKTVISKGDEVLKTEANKLLSSI